MKLVVLEEIDSPDPVDVRENGDILLEDSPFWNNLQVGDQLQLRTEDFGTSCYFVIDVLPADPQFFPHHLRFVTIREESPYERVHGS